MLHCRKAMTTCCHSPQSRPLLWLKRWSSGFVVGASLLACSQAAIANPLASRVTHLYGQSAADNTASATYMIFQVHQQRISGAFYQRSSSFDCFYGEITSDQMHLTVIDSLAQTAHPYALAVRPIDTEVAQTVSTALPVQPQGFYSVGEIQAVDRQVLNTCLNNYPLQPSI